MRRLIREMEEKDVEIVRRIYAAGWQDAFRGIVPQEYVSQMDFQHWTPPIGGSYVVEGEDGVAGTVTISAGREAAYQDWGEIISLYVFPERIGQGYGHALFQFAIDTLLGHGYRSLYLTVLEQNTRARKFYERHGFSWNGDCIPLRLAGKELTALRYIRQEMTPV